MSQDLLPITRHLLRYSYLIGVSGIPHGTGTATATEEHLKTAFIETASHREARGLFQKFLNRLECTEEAAHNFALIYTVANAIGLMYLSTSEDARFEKDGKVLLRLAQTAPSYWTSLAISGGGTNSIASEDRASSEDTGAGSTPALTLGYWQQLIRWHVEKIGADISDESLKNVAGNFIVLFPSTLRKFFKQDLFQDSRTFALQCQILGDVTTTALSLQKEDTNLSEVSVELLDKIQSAAMKECANLFERMQSLPAVERREVLLLTRQKFPLLAEILKNERTQPLDEAPILTPDMSAIEEEAERIINEIELSKKHEKLENSLVMIAPKSQDADTARTAIDDIPSDPNIEMRRISREKARLEAQRRARMETESRARAEDERRQRDIARAHERELTEPEPEAYSSHLQAEEARAKADTDRMAALYAREQIEVEAAKLASLHENHLDIGEKAPEVEPHIETVLPLVGVLGETQSAPQIKDSRQAEPSSDRESSDQITDNTQLVLHPSVQVSGFVGAFVNNSAELGVTSTEESAPSFIAEKVPIAEDATGTTNETKLIKDSEHSIIPQTLVEEAKLSDVERLQPDTEADSQILDEYPELTQDIKEIETKHASPVSTMPTNLETIVETEIQVSVPPNKEHAVGVPLILTDLHEEVVQKLIFPPSGVAKEMELEKPNIPASNKIQPSKLVPAAKKQPAKSNRTAYLIAATIVIGALFLFSFISKNWKLKHTPANIQNSMLHVTAPSYLSVIPQLEAALGSNKALISPPQERASASISPPPESRKLSEQIPEDAASYPLALKSMAHSRFDDSLQQLDKAIKENPSSAIKTALAYSEVETYTGRFTEALTWATKARDLDPKNNELLRHVAIAQLNMGAYSEAEKYCKLLIDKQNSDGLKDSIEASTTDDLLASIYSAQGKFELAEPLYKKSLSMYEAIKGKDSPDTEAALNHLAELYSQQGRLKDAEPLYRRALEISERTYGKDSLNTADRLSNLAGIAIEQQQYDRAEQFLRRALDIQVKNSGENNRDAALTLNNLAGLYNERKQYAKAEELFKRAIVIQTKVLGADSPETAQTEQNLGNLYNQQGKYAAAETLYVRVLSIREKKLGKDHRDTAVSLNNLACLYTQQNKLTIAETYFKRSLSINEKALGMKHPEVANVCDNYAVLLHKMHKEKEAMDKEHRSKEIHNSINNG